MNSTPSTDDDRDAETPGVILGSCHGVQWIPRDQLDDFLRGVGVVLVSALLVGVCYVIAMILAA